MEKWKSDKCAQLLEKLKAGEKIEDLESKLHILIASFSKLALKFRGMTQAEQEVHNVQFNKAIRLNYELGSAIVQKLIAQNPSEMGEHANNYESEDVNMKKNVHEKILVSPSEASALVNVTSKDSNSEKTNIAKQFAEPSYAQFNDIIEPILSIRPIHIVSEKLVNIIIERIRQSYKLAASGKFSLQQQEKMIIACVENKFDESTRQLWKWHLITSKCEPNTDMLIEFLLLRIERKELLPINRATKAPRGAENPTPLSRSESINRPAGPPQQVTTLRNLADTICPLCKQRHKLCHCEQFRQMTIEYRWNFIEQANLCVNCLYKGHTSSVCLANCCTYCNKKHNSLLCTKTHGNAT